MIRNLSTRTGLSGAGSAVKHEKIDKKEFLKKHSEESNSPGGNNSPSVSQASEFCFVFCVFICCCYVVALLRCVMLGYVLLCVDLIGGLVVNKAYICV